MIEKDRLAGAVTQRSFHATMSYLAALGRRMRRRREKRVKRRALLQLLGSGQAASPGQTSSPRQSSEFSLVDPVGVAVLAIDRVAGASMRASFSGTEVQIAAPDEMTACVLRAALAETARTRPTDRLIRIVVR